jgi:hypothetical protein
MIVALAKLALAAEARLLAIRPTRMVSIDPFLGGRS